MMQNQILIKVVQCIHLGLIIFVLLGPLYTERKHIDWHLGITIYLLFRWIFNSNKCELTEIECKLRGIEKSDGFIYSILNPIVQVNKHKFNKVIVATTMLLGAISYQKLYS